MDMQSGGGNLPLGLVGGIAAALVGAVIWAVVTVTTGYQIGWMAIGVGFLVGYAVRLLGKGSSRAFNLTGAACALFGCLLGNLLVVCGFISQQESEPVLSVVASVLTKPSLVASLMERSFSAMDLLFYAFAIYEGFKLSTVPPAPAPPAPATGEGSAAKP